MTKVFSRSEMKLVKGAHIEGIWRAAGLIYDFRSIPSLDRFIPTGVAITWVSLENLEPLDKHVHPIESFVAIVKGRAKVAGETDMQLDEGQVVHIPAERWHGFDAVDKIGFQGLAWQFADTHLFGAGKSRLTFFPGETPFDSQTSCTPFNALKTPVTSKINPLVRFEALRLEAGQTVKLPLDSSELWSLGFGHLEIQKKDGRFDMHEGDSAILDTEETRETLELTARQTTLIARFHFETGSR